MCPQRLGLVGVLFHPLLRFHQPRPIHQRAVVAQFGRHAGFTPQAVINRPPQPHAKGCHPAVLYEEVHQSSALIDGLSAKSGKSN
ncbi:hypothetical protein HC928_25925 [bacterium]|nr:hypothetical protein [bacterium]